MAFTINLRWVNPNDASVSIKIYRSATMIDRNNPGTPIAEVNGDVDGYADEGLTYGLIYYYMFESSKDGDVAKSRVFQFHAVPFTGPGPQRLVAGNINYGYYGSLPTVEFISDSELIARCGLSWTAANNAGQRWHKFAWKGRTFYVPEYSIATGTLYWMDLYNAGLVYSKNAVPSAVPGVTTPVPQGKRINFALSEFEVSLPSVLVDHDDPNSVSDLSSSAATALGNSDPSLSNGTVELFLAGMTSQFYANKTLERVNVTGDNEATRVNSKAILTRDTPTTPASAYISRSTSATKASALVPQHTGRTSSSNIWFPVLELIPGNFVDFEV
ncbi:hypothetical protein [Pseudomonas phage vB_PaeM_PS119XW]|uniref:Virion structural protein n=1 Tax=Pseudomonas phage vB_PaeM_PS119XW TaxID=2601632 RepID=A0A5C1K8V8_9CAUD|nr:virion structural protein [Pseudomonas phage vB_PaeM_PS119XW]QEM41963.1 hypothetical protein [Pseudomonas phage vB_PaeM_PS119XW]